MVWVGGNGGGSGCCCYDGRRVHQFFEFLGGIIFEVFEVELAFEADGRSVADYVERFGGLGFDVVGHVDGFVV